MGRSLPATEIAPPSEASASPPPAHAPILGFVLAWALSLLPSLAGAELDRSLGDGSRLVLASLPWIVWIGLPARRERRGESRPWLLALGLALPPLCLAGWLDWQFGHQRGAVPGTAAFVAVILVLLGEAGHQAAAGARRFHGLLWLAIVPGAAALSAALSWAVDGRASASGMAGFLASVSPIGTLWRDFFGGDAIPLAAAVLRAASLACALLLGFTWLSVRRRKEAS